MVIEARLELEFAATLDMRFARWTCKKEIRVDECPEIGGRLNKLWQLVRVPNQAISEAKSHLRPTERMSRPGIAVSPC